MKIYSWIRIKSSVVTLIDTNVINKLFEKWMWSFLCRVHFIPTAQIFTEAPFIAYRTQLKSPIVSSWGGGLPDYTSQTQLTCTSWLRSCTSAPPSLQVGTGGPTDHTGVAAACSRAPRPACRRTPRWGPSRSFPSSDCHLAPAPPPAGSLRTAGTCPPECPSWAGAWSCGAACTCSRGTPSCGLPGAAWPRRWKVASRRRSGASTRHPAACWSQSCAFWGSPGPSCASGPGTRPWTRSWAAWLYPWGRLRVDTPSLSSGESSRCCPCSRSCCRWPATSPERSGGEWAGPSASARAPSCCTCWTEVWESFADKNRLTRWKHTGSRSSPSTWRLGAPGDPN